MGWVQVDRPGGLLGAGADWCGLVRPGVGYFCGVGHVEAVYYNTKVSEYLDAFLGKLEVTLKNSCKTEEVHETSDNCNGTTHGR